MYPNFIIFVSILSSNQTTIINETFNFFSSLISALLYVLFVFLWFICLVTIGILILALLFTVLFIQYPPLIYNSIAKIGIYHQLVRNEDTKDEKSKFGELFWEKVWLVFKYNFWIAIPLFVTLLFLLNSFIITPIPSFGNVSEITSNISAHNNQNQNPIDIRYFISLSIIPAFLLSLRLLANPTWNGVITFNQELESNFSSLLVNVKNLIYKKSAFIESADLISDDERKKRVRAYKEQVISFYFSFVGSTLILFFLFIFLQIEQSKGNYDPLSVFSPIMNPLATGLFFIAEAIAIFVVTTIGELYLIRADPIDQI